MPVSDRDKGFVALTRRLVSVSSGTLTVGVHAAEGAAPATGSKGASLSDVATYNEFGTSRIPARSFVRAWADIHAARNRETLREIAKAVYAGRYTAEQGLARAGTRFVAEIQARIASGISPPNVASTIAKKGSSTPLIDTGQLRASITYKVSHA